MYRSTWCLCCGLSLLQIPAQCGGDDTGAGWKAMFDSYLHLFARARPGRCETQDGEVWEGLR